MKILTKNMSGSNAGGNDIVDAINNPQYDVENGARSPRPEANRNQISGATAGVAEPSNASAGNSSNGGGYSVGWERDVNEAARKLFRLIYSGMDGSSEISRILNDWGSDVVRIVDHEGRNLLEVSVETGNLDMLKLVRQFIDNNTDRPIKMFYDGAPRPLGVIDAAIASGKTMMVKYCLAYLAASTAQLSGQCYYDVFDKLLNSGRAKEAGYFAEKIKTLKLAKDAETRKNPLHLVLSGARVEGGIASGNLVKLVSLLAEKGAAVDEKDTQGQTALHYAAQLNDSDVTKVLLESCKGSGLDAKNPNGDTPLGIAARSGNLGVVRQLCKLRPNFSASNYEGQTPMSLAVFSGDLATIRYFLNRLSHSEAADVITREDNDGHTIISKLATSRDPEVRGLLKSAMDKVGSSIYSRASFREAVRLAAHLADTETLNVLVSGSLALGGAHVDMVRQAMIGLFDFDGKSPEEVLNCIRYARQTFSGDVKLLAQLGYGAVGLVQVPLAGGSVVTVEHLRNVSGGGNKNGDLLEENIVSVFGEEYRVFAQIVVEFGYLGDFRNQLVTQGAPNVTSLPFVATELPVFADASLSVENANLTQTQASALVPPSGATASSGQFSTDALLGEGPRDIASSVARTRQAWVSESVRGVVQGSPALRDIVSRAMQYDSKKYEDNANGAHSGSRSV